MVVSQARNPSRRLGRVVADRPQVPAAYGYSTKETGMLTWERVQEALAAATIYWIGTARPDGSPNLHPIWGAWVGEHLYFEGGDTTRWARNLAADPRVSFGVESGGLHISGRGRVVVAPATDEFGAVANSYSGKYSYRPETDQFYRVSPDTVIAVGMSSMEEFVSSPTRFRFTP